MDALVVTWRELLIIIVAVLAIYVVQFLVLLRWSGAPRARWWKRADGASVEALGREVGDLRKQLTQLQSEVERFQATPASASPYNRAIQMARKGAGAGEVASGCGISRGEAELIVALYRKLRI